MIENPRIVAGDRGVPESFMIPRVFSAHHILEYQRRSSAISGDIDRLAELSCSWESQSIEALACLGPLDYELGVAKRWSVDDEGRNSGLSALLEVAWDSGLDSCLS